jgi:hypothetical protein
MIYINESTVELIVKFDSTFSNLYQVFINTFNTLIENKDYFLVKWQELLVGENLLLIYTLLWLKRW